MWSGGGGGAVGLGEAFDRVERELMIGGKRGKRGVGYFRRRVVERAEGWRVEVELGSAETTDLLFP